MPAIVDLVAAISDDVVASLAAAGYPALTDGAILLGGQHLFEQSAPPRIVFVPTRSTFGPRDPSNPAQVSGANLSEQQAQQLQRPIGTELVTFGVHVWGQGATIDFDYDITQALYQQVMISLHNLAEGCYKIGPGEWTSGKPSSTQVGRAGQEFVFGLEIATPVLDALLAYAPSQVAGSVGVNLTDGIRIINHVDVTTP